MVHEGDGVGEVAAGAVVHETVLHIAEIRGVPDVVLIGVGGVNTFEVTVGDANIRDVIE